MTDDKFEMPDMDELARQMEDAMGAAKKALDDLPDEMEDMENIMGSLSGLMDGLPAQMEALTGALSGFDEQHQENVSALAGNPNWSLNADIWVENKLHIVIKAIFDLEKIQETWKHTQGAGFESIVADVAGDLEDEALGQIMGQLKKGRSLAQVESIEVLACHIQGAPPDAEKKLQLSPEGHIPLVLDENGIGFEFAPVLTIRNQWEHATIPTFSPMGAEIMVPLDHFEEDTFVLKFEPEGQAEELVIELSFQPIAGLA